MNKSTISLPSISTLLSSPNIENDYTINNNLNNNNTDLILPKLKLDNVSSANHLSINDQPQEIISPLISSSNPSSRSTSPSFSPISSSSNFSESSHSNTSTSSFLFVSPIESFIKEDEKKKELKDHSISINNNNKSPIIKKKRGRPPIYSIYHHHHLSSSTIYNNNHINNDDELNNKQDWTFLTPTICSPLSQLNQEQKNKWLKNQQQPTSGNTTQSSSSSSSSSSSVFSSSSSITHSSTSLTNLDQQLILGNGLPWKKRGRKPKLNYSGNNCFVWKEIPIIRRKVKSLNN